MIRHDLGRISLFLILSITIGLSACRKKSDSSSGGSTPPPGSPAVPTAFTQGTPGDFSLGITSTPTFSWTDSTGETSYRLEIATDAGFTSITYTDSSLSANATIVTIPTSILTALVPYFWRIVAVNAGGETVATNAPFTFTPFSWAKTYGDTGTDELWELLPLSDGGALLGGRTGSFGAGSNDAWLLKIGSDGTVLWEKTYGGTSHDYIHAVVENGSGYIAAGRTQSEGAGSNDGWLAGINSDGTLQWQRALGGTDQDYFYDIKKLADGNFLVCGRTRSFGAGGYDLFLVKIDEGGIVLWEKTLGGTGDEEAWQILTQTNGDAFVVGFTDSFGAGSDDLFLVRIQTTGTVVWQKTYGGTGTEFGRGITEIAGGDVLVTGRTNSSGAGDYDLWALRIAGAGGVVWQKTYGGLETDFGRGATPAGDGNYLLMGYTSSMGAGLRDAWLLKIDSDGNSLWQKTYGGTSHEFVYKVRTAPMGEIYFGGRTSSFGAGGYDLFVGKADLNGSMSPLATDQAAVPATSTVVPADAAGVLADTTATVTATTLTVGDSTATVGTQAP